MTEEPPAPRRIIEETDWSTLTHGAGPAYPGTPATLSGLVSGDSVAVTAALAHLADDLLHQGSLYPATGPAARYVAALLADPSSREPLTPSWDQGKYPLRARLLGWLAGVAEAVSDAAEQKIEAWFGYSAEERVPHFREVRQIRPELFRGVAACLDDDDPLVRRAALVAAVYLADDPKLRSQRERLAPAVENELATGSEERHRSLAVKTLAVWRGEAPSTVTDDDLWGDEPEGDRGPLDDPPF